MSLTRDTRPHLIPINPRRRVLVTLHVFGWKYFKDEHTIGKPSPFPLSPFADHAFTRFSRASKREVRVYDANTLETLGCVEFDVSPAILDVHYDEGTGLAFLSAKGDTSIRLIECVEEAPWMYILDPFMSAEPQQGVAFLLKTECDIK